MQQEATREKIRAGLLIKTLEDHVINGKELQPSQVTAALGLLKKCVPDLSATEHTGEMIHKHVQELSDSELAHIATAGSTRVIAAQASTKEPTGIH